MTSASGERDGSVRAAPGGRLTRRPAESNAVAAPTMNRPPTPNHDKPMRTPARAGATTRIASWVVWLSMTAGPICSGSTTSTMNAIRAGR